MNHFVCLRIKTILSHDRSASDRNRGRTVRFVSKYSPKNIFSTCMQFSANAFTFLFIRILHFYWQKNPTKHQ